MPTPPMRITATRLLKYLIAILLGNAVYFLLSPHMAPAARGAASRIGWGTLVDLWFCVAMYGLIELGVQLGRRRPPRKGD